MGTNRQKVIGAIRSLGLRVTASDVAATTGLPLWDVIRELNKVSADAQAVLQVSKEGLIAYQFRGDPEAVYAAKGIQKAFDELVTKLKHALFFIVRCSFGVLLLGSIITLLIIFVVAIAFAMFAADGADGHMDTFDADFDAGDMEWNFFDVANLTMFFTWWKDDVSGEWDYYGQTVRLKETGFISNCFSFLFGDGNPNRNYYGEEAWRYIADLIRLNNGVITAAQVGPYAEAYATDDGMFPVLVRFDGVPQVTPTGNIVYAFPTMQTTAAGHVFKGLPKFGELKQWKFCEVPARKLDFVFYFAGANLAGWWAVAGNLHHFDFAAKYKPLVGLLLAYAVFFIAFPMVRTLINAVRNAVIEVRNHQRERLAAELAKPQMQAKIREAQIFATSMQWVDPSQIAYTTAESLMDQELDVLPPLQPPVVQNRNL
jgi:hypothetical protein